MAVTEDLCSPLLLGLDTDGAWEPASSRGPHALSQTPGPWKGRTWGTGGSGPPGRPSVAPAVITLPRLLHLQSGDTGLCPYLTPALSLTWLNLILPAILR